VARAATTLYYFLVEAQGTPHEPAVLTTQTAVRHVGEVIVLEDGSRVRVLAIEPALAGGSARRGLDGVLVVEPHAGA
jgi:hypothetical protein